MTRASLGRMNPLDVFRALAWGILLGIAAQFFLAGLTVFGGGTGWGVHATTGGALALPILTAFAMTLKGALTQFRGGMSLLLAGYLVQVALAALGNGLPMLGALHPVNGLAMGLVTSRLVSGAGSTRLSPEAG